MWIAVFLRYKHGDLIPAALASLSEKCIKDYQIQYGWDQKGREVLYFTPEGSTNLAGEDNHADPFYYPFWGPYNHSRKQFTM